VKKNSSTWNTLYNIKRKKYKTVCAELAFVYVTLGHGWLSELDSWNTYQLIQAYHQYGVGLRPAF
jgi:hypothetical protein